MAITDWFKARDERRYTTSLGREDRSAAAEGAWAKCDDCGRIVYEGELEDSHRVCPHCRYHFPYGAQDRIALFVDEGTFEETDAGLFSRDPLRFDCGKPYVPSLEKAREKTGLAEAAVTGRASLAGHPVMVGAMDFEFMGASMGSAVGEKMARVFVRALDERRGVVISTSSGGARMQEGMLSLMQMAKTSAAVARFSDAGLPFISILAHPTMGGVTASFAVLADVIFAEPGALIGFAGPRVIEQTIGQKLPRGFQRADFQVEHGMVDAVVPRDELRERVALALDYLMPEGGAR